MPRRGDIVLVAFPFTDLSGEKRRPALIIASSRDHCVTLFITSRTLGEKKWNVPISATKESGLAIPSILRCDKIASFDAQIVQGAIGKAPQDTMRRIDAKLRTLLRL